MEFRKIFDSIPEQFDKWRPRYCDEAFSDIIQYAKLDTDKTVLEIGPGTGQATEPILKTGSSYLAIELGEHLAEFTKNKFSSYPNFHIVNSDFETHDFGQQNFDLVYSAATIQWIPEEVGFPKVYDLLKSGGTFAMMMTRTDYKTPNEEMFAKIQDVYNKYFYPAYNYSCSLAYSNVDKHGFVDFECRNYHKARELNADEFVLYIGTHCDHIALEEPLRTSFFDGIRNVILGMGNKILLNDNIVLYLAKKPYSPI
ncbi:class I SAM-dependent methyltransferase [Bacteroides sp.]|uniref:class I SAM-dependent methyltransferase n=1 Tax=Bacteroides sp. TaxID=29523 RepID=UPI00261127DF|nr:class I SAM-dependent methyltransferase [Bacteroides sp.]MDD3041068.1 class I SAM-dependent methyltransferase [Bacteroides sp.]